MAAVEEFIQQQPETQQAILQQLRELVHQTVPNCSEEIKWSKPVFSLQGNFCYFATSKKYVSLGFFNFEKITDGSALLEGTGKQMRHIKIHSIDDIDNALFAKMIQQSSALS